MARISLLAKKPKVRKANTGLMICSGSRQLPVYHAQYSQILADE